MIGHSLGEYVAALQANVFDLQTALMIIFKRGCLIAKTESAKMLAVKYANCIDELAMENIDEKWLKIPETIEISAILHSNVKCLVGKPEIIDEFVEKLENDQIQCRELMTNYGFHSSFMDSILDEFEQFLKNFTFQKPTKQILSNIDGEIIKHFDAKYMVKHLRSAVRLDKCIENLSDQIKVIIEIGPKGILESLLNANKQCNLLHIATKLWMKGYELNWKQICGNYGFDRFLPNYQFEKNICWEDQQTNKWHSEKIDVNLYEPCWIPCKFTNRQQLPKAVLLFVPQIITKSIDALLKMLHNLFVPVQCIFNDTLLTGNINVIDGNIYINANNKQSYHELANFLHNNNNFYYDTIIHAWNFPVNYEMERNNDDSYLLLSFYSIYWILTNITQNMADLKFLISIGWNTEPEIFTLLGPIRELVMTKRSMKAACILCTPEVDLFDALQLLESYQANFCLIRNSVNGKFEHFSYQLKSTESDNYLIGKEDDESSIDKNDCLIRNADVIVIFGFGSIGQSFVTVLCQNFNCLTICIASPNATRHFEQCQSEINQWKISRKFEMLEKVDLSNVATTDVTINEQHKFFAYDIDVTKEDDVRHLLTQIRLQHKQINVIIHAAAGKVDSIKFDKNFDEIQFVLQPKIRAIRNVINTLHENNINIRSLILNSSMNALFGLPGNSDYAASNIFLDACCERNFQNIRKITTIQWTGWKGSNMLSYYNSKENKSQNPVANLIIEYSLSVQEAEQMIRKCFYQQGLIAVSFINPNDIIRQIRKLNFALNHDKFATTISEQKKSVKMNCNNFKDIIAKIWSNYLGVKQITDYDDFFQLGGHSLNGNEQKFPHKLKNYKMFDSIDKLKWIRLSYPQENMYILRELQHSTLYNICFLLTFQGLICMKSLQKAFLFLIARQTSLRTTFVIINDICYQEIQSLTESYYHMIWPMLNEYERDKLINDEKNHVMDLSQIPFRILSMCNNESNDKNAIEYMIMISQHHIITDGWSMTIFANELGKFYHYCLTKESIPETFKRLSYNVTHFAVWQRSDKFTKMINDDLKRLCAKLQQFHATQIITHKTTIMITKLIKQKIFKLPSSLWAQINQTAKHYQQTVYTVMLTAFLCLIRKFSNDYDNDTIVIGCPQVREAIQDARSFEHLPFHLLVANLSYQRQYTTTNQHPIFNIFFNYRHNLDFPKIEIANVKSTIIQLTTNDAFDFAFTIDETNDNGTLITINYNANQYSNQLIDEMITVYFKLLKSISGKFDDCIRNEMYDLKCKMYHHCDILSGSLIDVIKEQSMHTDKLTAFCNSYQTITYQQMYNMICVFSKQITQFYLQNNCESIRADTIIPICADSNAIIAPLLAVQLIGAAYAPIDPANSTTMIAQLVQEIGATIIIIVQENNLNLDIPILTLKQFATFANQQSCIEWNMDYFNKKLSINKKYLQSIDLSYVIFTSGTTGNQKLADNILNATNEIVEKNVQFAFLSAALFNMFDNDEINQLQQLQQLYVGGETVNNQQLNRCLQLGISICQIYGPTETTIWSLTNHCSILEYECGRVIGTVIDNEIAYVLDSENNITYNGGKGELVISGNGISRGYLNSNISHVFTRNKFHTKKMKF
ncbi:hypothetical protein WUBG_04158 [Wuchereria bancrofti]|uniref:Malonyl-CoA:ACP transacylase (MAT) domain-containing protein n=1 Tax=Wuchereria bancrofti TaxID=6293 RepID=J9EQW2_WUCBA|nr:hypothetical protein WUBG_04158 [Wuchereria bancrofti]